jgi:site-specific recombinase XerD
MAVTPPRESADACLSGHEWARRFIQEARDEGRLRASTIAAYAMDLAMTFRWAADQQLDLTELTTADLMRYAVERAIEGVLPSTIARNLSTCRCFYAFLVRRGVVAANPATGVVLPRVASCQPAVLSAEVVHRLLRLPGQGRFGVAAWRARRDHAIVCMLYGTRLRVSEVRLLRWQQIDADRRLVRIPTVDGGSRSRILDASLLALLTSLRDGAAGAGFEWSETPYCFPSASGLPMTRQALCHVVRKWGAERGDDPSVTPSALRRTGRATRSGRGVTRLAPAPVLP